MYREIKSLQVRGLFSDFYYILDGIQATSNRPYLSATTQYLSPEFERFIPNRNLDFSGANQNSAILERKEICWIDKNSLLVYGKSSTYDFRMLEIYEFVNNSPTQVSKVI